MGLTVRTATDLAALEALRPAWGRLSGLGAGDPLFGSHLWNLVWWRHYRSLGDLHVLTAVDGDEIVGIWPLYLSSRTYGEVEVEMIGPRKMPLPGKDTRARVLAYLGSGEICSDFLQPIVPPERAPEVLTAMARHLAATPDWDVLDLTELPAESPLLPALGAALAESFGKVRRRHRYFAPYAPLAATFDDYLETLSKKSRYNARKKLRQLQLNHTVEHVFHEDPATLGEAMDTLIRLHQERWVADGLPGVFVNERFIGFHHEMAAAGLARGWLRLGLLRVNNKPVFATYGYQIGDRVYLYQQGSDPDPHWDTYNLGYVALNFAIADAVERGARLYDFLRGEAAYKLHWAREKRELVQWQAARGGWRGRLFMIHSAINTDDQLRAKVKRLIGR